jgi:hypothetical protein
MLNVIQLGMVAATNDLVYLNRSAFGAFGRTNDYLKSTVILLKINLKKAQLKP